MKPSIKTLFAVGCAYAVTAASSLAQLYTFDEYGDSTGLGISPGTLQPDPSGGLPVPVMVFNLAFPVITGDVWMTEPASPAGSEPYSDLVRFWDPTSGPTSQIIFYSDTDEAVLAPADTGLPSTSLPLSVTIPEVGPEGNNGAVYTPTANQPGYILSTAVPPATYDIVSDGVVPEPATVALAALGGGLLLLIQQRRHQTRI